MLLLAYSYTGQTRALLDAAGDVFAERGWEVESAPIVPEDPRIARRFGTFPMRRVWPDMLSVLPAQARRATCAVTVPESVVGGDYDLVCLGSPTWWSAASMPMRSFLKSDDARKLLAGNNFAVFIACRGRWRGNLAEITKLGRWQGGRYAGEYHATYPGNEVTSMLSLTSYLGSGEYREKYLGVTLPPTNVSAAQLDEARGFAESLADSLVGRDG